MTRYKQGLLRFLGPRQRTPPTRTRVEWIDDIGAAPVGLMMVKVFFRNLSDVGSSTSGMPAGTRGSPHWIDVGEHGELAYAPGRYVMAA